MDDWTLDPSADAHTVMYMAKSTPEEAKKMGPEIGKWNLAAPNMELLEESARLFLRGLGEDPTRSDLVDTPKRVAKMYSQVYQGYFQRPEDFITEFDNGDDTGGKYIGPVILKNAELYSTCAHHFQPFIGEISIAYQPKDRIVGLSKLLRVARVYAKRLQVQEKLTQQVADALWELLDPEWVVVRYEAEHYCMRLRGVRVKGSSTVTLASHGDYPQGVFNV
jgi:GTP cyclohydrolase I